MGSRIDGNDRAGNASSTRQTSGLEPHEEDLENDLGIKTARIQQGTNADLKASWKGDEGYIPLWGENTKESHEWKDVYSNRNFYSRESRNTHESIQKNMIGPDGEALSDEKLSPAALIQPGVWSGVAITAGPATTPPRRFNPESALPCVGCRRSEAESVCDRGGRSVRRQGYLGGRGRRGPAAMA